jgi:hypothetical protein
MRATRDPDLAGCPFSPGRICDTRCAFYLGDGVFLRNYYVDLLDTGNVPEATYDRFIRCAYALEQMASTAVTAIDEGFTDDPATDNSIIGTLAIADGTGYENSRVRVYNSDTRAFVRSVTPGAGGVFDTGDLDDGNYKLLLVDMAYNYAQVWYPNEVYWTSATVVTLSGGAAEDIGEQRFVRDASQITGNVSSSDPIFPSLSDATVYLYDSTAEVHMATIYCDEPSGDYRIRGVIGGRVYKVYAEANLHRERFWDDKATWALGDTTFPTSGVNFSLWPIV